MSDKHTMPCACSICLKLSHGAYKYTHEVESCPCGTCHAARMESKATKLQKQTLVKTLVGAIRRAMRPQSSNR
jgi:hypothetical protein